MEIEKKAATTMSKSLTSFMFQNGTYKLANLLNKKDKINVNSLSIQVKPEKV